jgi:formyltetrahydrofolate deformylase
MPNSTEGGARAILLLSCQDRPGLVAAVSNFIAGNGGNIIHADQHTDSSKGIFLQRVEWQLAGFKIARAGLAEAFRPLAENFGMSWRVHFTDERPRVAVLVSSLGHCLYDLLVRWRMGEFRAEVAVVAGNHDALRGAAESFGVGFRHLGLEPGGKAAQEGRLLKLLRREKVELVVLARYMQILSPAFIEAFRGRIINIHHSFLPAFAGAKPYHRAHARGVKLIGATAHYATEDLDEGPIIAQDVARVSHRDAVEDLMLKGRDLEKLVLARAVKLHLDRRVIVYGNKTAVFD